jgi:hypothetical protein
MHVIDLMSLLVYRSKEIWNLKKTCTSPDVVKSDFICPMQDYVVKGISCSIEKGTKEILV